MKATVAIAEDASPEEIEAAWALEIKRRIEDLDSGRVKAIPWDEAIRQIESDEDDEANRRRRPRCDRRGPRRADGGRRALPSLWPPRDRAHPVGGGPSI